MPQANKGWVARLFEKQPWLWPVVALACGVGNLYGYHIHYSSSPLAAFVDLAFAIVGFLTFIVLLAGYLTDFFSK